MSNNATLEIVEEAPDTWLADALGGNHQAASVMNLRPGVIQQLAARADENERARVDSLVKLVKAAEKPLQAVLRALHDEPNPVRRRERTSFLQEQLNRLEADACRLASLLEETGQNP